MLDFRLFKETDNKKIYRLLVIIMPILNAAFIIASAYALSSIINAVFQADKKYLNIDIYFFIFIVNVALKVLFNYLLGIFINNSAEDIKENIKKKSFRHIISGNPLKVRQESLGEIINELTEGCEMITPYFSKYIPQFFASVITPMIIFIAALSVDLPSALIMIITYPIIPVFMALIGYKSKILNEKQWKKLMMLSSHFMDMLQGLSTLKVFGRSKNQEEKVFNTSENYRKATMDVLKVSFSSALVLEFFSTISTALIAVDLGLRLVYYKISFLHAFFILILAPDFYLPVRNLGLRFHASLNGKIAIEKIDNLLKRVGFENDISNTEKMLGSIYKIEIRNLNFYYGEKQAIKNLSLKIEKGEKVALVGQSGSGKSTLINILSGFIKVDDGMVFINGKDINSINRSKLMNEIAIIPQFPHIFNKSIEDNVILGNKEINADKLNSIYRLTKIEELVNKFPVGYKTIIGEGEAVSLSGGEQQRISLARALWKNASFFILDEPSSALDLKSEAIFDELIDVFMENKTMIIAAHRLNTIIKADRIVVLHEGNLIEEGTHEKLISNKNKYFEFINALEV